MRQLASSVVRWIRDDLGYPASLHHVLRSAQVRAASLPEVPFSIAASSVVRWNEWGSICDGRGPRFAAGEMLGWREIGGHYSSFYLTRDDLARIGTREVRDLWECEIQDVVGLSSSKSELRDFTSLDDLVEANSRSMIEPVSAETLDRNLAWSEIRILHRDSTSDHFACYRWDGRLFLMNAGGSHHFAAARYIASRLCRRIPLRGRLVVYGLNRSSIASLARDYEIFVIPNEPASYLAFHDAMTACRATYLHRALPRPYGDRRAVFLPRSELRSSRVADLLRNEGFFDLGAHLQMLCAAGRRR
ncbi:hypothetical protein I5M83_22120 [Pseudomonas aeruginosa]|nr:hypothetical protein [Pseudomonas aeruginosa]